MKTINTYIFEKLKLTSQSKLKKEPINIIKKDNLNDICDIFYLIEKSQISQQIKLKKFIKKWIDENDVNEIKIILSNKSIDSLSNGDSDIYDFIESLVNINDMEATNLETLYYEDIQKFKSNKNRKRLGIFDKYCNVTGNAGTYEKEIFSDGDILVCLIHNNYMFITKK